jgi:hypothetical protein
LTNHENSKLHSIDYSFVFRRHAGFGEESTRGTILRLFSEITSIATTAGVVLQAIPLTITVSVGERLAQEQIDHMHVVSKPIQLEAISMGSLSYLKNSTTQVPGAFAVCYLRTMSASRYRRHPRQNLE